MWMLPFEGSNHKVAFIAGQDLVGNKSSLGDKLMSAQSATGYHMTRN